VRVHSRRWQQRLIFVAGGVAVGFVAVGIALASDAVHGAQGLIARWPLSPLLLTPMGFGVAVFLAVTFFPFTRVPASRRRSPPGISRIPVTALTLSGCASRWAKFF
jgi:hypothetical protein